MSRLLRVALVTGVSLLLLSAVATGLEPSFDTAHEYTDHEAALTDVEFDDRHGITYSLDEEGGFVAYDVQAGEVAFHHPFETGHALAIGDDAVYVAVGGTLWEFDVAAGELSELTTLDDHAGDLAYDAARDVVWVAGHETVYGYEAEDGAEFMRYTEHSGGLGAIAVEGDYVATGTQFDSEIVVYDVETAQVAYEPELQTDVQFVTALDLTENGELVVGTGAENDDVIAMFDIASGEQRAQYRHHVFGVSFVEYDSTTDVIISTGFDNTVKVYDVTEESITAQYQHEDTIYTADLDRSKDLLWIGDGEERVGTVTALDIAEEATPTEEPTEAAADPAADEPPDTEAPDEPAETDSDGQPGFGPVVAIAAVLGLVAVISRRF